MVAITNSDEGGVETMSKSTLRWTAAHLAMLSEEPQQYTPVLGPAQALPMAKHLDVWDAWPLADVEGNPVTWNGGELWFALAISRAEDPEHRHHIARIHHFHRHGDHFKHLGETLPERFAPGSRQWSGSALCENGHVTLFFTATGRRSDKTSTFHQRIFSTSAPLQIGPDSPFGDWSKPYEPIKADGTIYQPANQDVGEPGKIKAFRDPAFYRDDDGTDFLLFTGSSAETPGAHDGVIGLARADASGDYRMLAPLIDASGANNELERPHIVKRDGQLYLFWSTQRGVFAPGITAPTGLYGATAKSITGPWQLLNGHGLVFANPVESPTQAYSWWVLPDLSVTSFVDYWLPEDQATSGRERFGGTFAPFVHIELDGAQAQLKKD